LDDGYLGHRGFVVAETSCALSCPTWFVSSKCGSRRRAEGEDLRLVRRRDIGQHPSPIVACPMGLDHRCSVEVPCATAASIALTSAIIQDW
jgi:hypothetical protein